MSSAIRGIGLLGGSFDPVHKGHVAICRSYLNSRYLKQLFVILTPDPPHKHDQELTAFNHRLNMLKIALSDIDHLEVSDVENKLSKPSYTVNTVRFFNKKFPGSQLYLCIGEDSFKEFTDWYHWEEIIENCTLLVARRPDSGNYQLPEQLNEKARFIEHEKIAISSSDIRNRLKQGEDVAAYLPGEVMSYIHDNHLYQTEN